MILYRSLAKKVTYQKLTDIKSFAAPFPPLTRGNGTLVADLAGDILVLGGYTTQNRTMISYVRVEPDGSDMTLVNSITVTNQRQAPSPQIAFYPRGFELRTDSTGQDVRIWTVTPVTPNSNYSTNGFHRYQISGGQLNANVVGNTIANNYPNYTSTSTYVSQSKNLYSRMGTTSNGAYYSTTGQLTTVAGVQTLHDQTYTGVPIYMVHELPTPGHTMVVYFKSGNPLNRAVDIWVNYTRTYVDVDASAIKLAYAPHIRAVKNVGNLVVFNQPPAVHSVVYNGAGGFSPHSTSPMVANSGISWPVELPDGRILIMGSFASTDTFTFNSTTGWSPSTDKVSTPTTLWAAAHSSGSIISIDAARNVRLSRIQ